MGTRFNPKQEAFAKMLRDATDEVSLNSVGEALDAYEYRVRMAEWIYSHASDYDIDITYYGGQ